MAASTLDKITDTRNAARPNSAKATGTRAVAGSSLACDSLAGWPTASKVHFVTYQVDSSLNPVAGTQLDCYGIVSGNSITSFTVVDGSDVGNVVGDYVEMLPTAAWGQDLADALTSTHNRSGGLKSGLTITTPTLTTPAIADFTSATHTHATNAQGGQLGASAIATGTSLADKLLNPYKFSVYRNSALNSGNGAYALVSFDTKVFDTGTNIDVVTNKGRFTAPVAGFYHFDASIATSASYSALAIALYKNGVVFNYGGRLNNTNSVMTGGVITYSDTIQLALNDYVEIFAFGNAATALDVSTPAQTKFSGYLISAT